MREKTWEKAEGRFLGNYYDSKIRDYVPTIEYVFRGKWRQDSCEFSLHDPNLGETVPILIDPESGRIFLSTFRGRWVLSSILLGCITALLALSYLSN